MGVVTELVTEFGFKGSVAPLDKFNSKMGSAIGIISAVGAGLVVAKGLVDTFVIATLKSADSMVHLSTNTGISLEAIQELGFAASMSGSSIEALEGTLASLSQKIGDAAQKGSADFSRLGISVRDSYGQIKTADTILGEVGQRFKELNLSMQEQQSFASALGIDASLVQLLGRSSAEMNTLKKRARDLGVVTTAQGEKVIEFNDSITTLKFGMGSLSKQIATGLAPELKGMTDDFIDLLVANKDFVVNGVKVTFKWIGYLFEAFIRLLPALTLIAGGFLIAQVAAWGFSGAMTLATAPLTIWIAGIALAALIIDDLITAFQGGKSVIGDFFMEAFGFDIVPVLKGYVAAVKNMLSAIKNLFKGLFNLATGDMTGFFDSMKDLFQNLLDFPAVKAMAAIFDKVGGFIGFGDEGNISPGNGSTSSSVSNNKVEQSVNIEIITDDPTTAGQSVTDSLQAQLLNANTQLKPGGL